MNDRLTKAKEMLKHYNQTHLLRFYDELSYEKKSILLKEIENIDFEFMANLYEHSKHDEEFKPKEISPLLHIDKKQLTKKEYNFYTIIGENSIKNNEFAVVTMAGGQGTRLGYKGPKGTYELKFAFFKKSLFAIICDDLKRINKKYDITLPWFIMTSEENHSATKEYFSNHNYFSYPKEFIEFFKQEQLPLINTEGKIILQEPYLIKKASCGNGNVFKSLSTSGILEKMKSKGIKWISFGGIDNILLKNCDPLFLGLTINKNYQIASKSYFKKQPLEPLAVFCKKNNRPSILDYCYIDKTISNLKDENENYLYREANLLSHLMSIEAVEKSVSFELPLHRAFKKNAFVNDEGVKEVPDKPNSFKFENFIFDAFVNFEDMLLLRVNEEEEFAPIKSFTGIYNPDTAMDKYEKFFGILKHDL